MPRTRSRLGLLKGIQRALFLALLALCTFVLAVPMGTLANPRATAAFTEEHEEKGGSEAGAGEVAQSKQLTPPATSRILRRSGGRFSAHVRPRTSCPRHLEAPVRHDTLKTPLRC